VIWQWWRAEIQLTRAVRAESDALARLHEAKLNYVRANRLTGRPGQRFDSLAELARAAVRTNQLELRNEAIACLVLPDGRPLKQWARTPRWYSFQFNASHRRYATNDAVGNLIIRDTETDALLAQIPVQGAKAVASFTAFSPDDRYLATMDEAGQARLWEWPPQTPRPLDLPRDAALIAFTPDNRALVVKHPDGSLHFLNTTSGMDEKSFPGPARLHWYDFQFNSPGDRFLTVTQGQVAIRRVSDGGHLTTLTAPDDDANGLGRAAWHPDGRRVAAASTTRISLWDVETGRQVGVFAGHEAPVVGLAFTRSGGYLVSASWDSTTRLWDPDTGREVLRLPDSGNALSVSTDDRRLSFQSWDQRQVRLYALADLTAGQLITLPPQTRHRVHHTGQPAFSPDGELVMVPDHDGIYVFATSKPELLALVPVEGTVCFSPDGANLFTGGARGAQRWPMNWSTDRSELDLGPPELLEPTRGLPVDGVELSRDGQWLVARAKHIVLTLRTSPPFEAVRFDKALRLGREPRISPDGRWVATVTPSYDRIQIFDGRTGKVATNLPTRKAYQCAFSPDSRWLAGMQLDSMMVWATSDWSVHRHIPHPPEEVRHGLAFSPDGRTLATFASDWKVRLLRFETGEELATFPAGRATTSVCFNSTGDRLAVVNESGYFDLWDLRRLREQLASLHLDWDMPPYPPAPPATAPRPLRVTVHTNAAAN
jgi:WD40 repeat protein